MDDRRFDSLARSLAAGRSRREVIKGMLGLGGAAVAGIALASDDAQAARRGFSGPTLPTPTCVPQCAGAVCGGDGCGGACGECSGTATCFEGACFRSCDPSGPSCDSACHCDAINFVCVFDQPVGTDCAANGCPTGSFCDDTDVCRSACASGA